MHLHDIVHSTSLQAELSFSAICKVITSKFTAILLLLSDSETISNSLLWSCRGQLPPPISYATEADLPTPLLCNLLPKSLEASILQVHPILCLHFLLSPYQICAFLNTAKSSKDNVDLPVLMC